MAWSGICDGPLVDKIENYGEGEEEREREDTGIQVESDLRIFLSLV
jgi:hypothetical protein